MKVIIALCVLACFAATVNAQSYSYTWSGGVLNFYNYNYTTNATGTFPLCSPQPVNNSLTGSASGSGATVTSAGCVTSSSTSAWANPNSYTVTCLVYSASAGGVSVTTTTFTGTEYSTATACSSKGTSTGRVLSAYATSGTVITGSTLGQCQTSYASGYWMNYAGTCPNASGALSTAVPSVLMVAAALLVAFASKQ